MKKLTLKDATKEELLQYFFGRRESGGGFVIPMDKERFLVWLKNKKTHELTNAQEESMNASQKVLEEYIGYLKQASDKKDTKEKIEIYRKANKVYKRYETINKRIESIEKKLKKMGE